MFLSTTGRSTSRCDDSVARVVAGAADADAARARATRREPFALPVAAPRPVLAVGGQLKHTVTLAAAAGRCSSPAHRRPRRRSRRSRVLREAIDQLRRWSASRPACVAHDLHPGLPVDAVRARPRRRRPRSRSSTTTPTSPPCLAEHGLAEPVLGVAFDGTGLGDDGTLWGGEFLRRRPRGYRRLGQLRPRAAARRRGRDPRARPGWRSATCSTPGSTSASGAGSLAGPARPARGRGRRRMVARGVNSPVASSAGRLFDAVAALLGSARRRRATRARRRSSSRRSRPADRPAAALPVARWRRASTACWSTTRGRRSPALLDGVAAADARPRRRRRVPRDARRVTVALRRRARGADGAAPVVPGRRLFQNAGCRADAAAALARRRASSAHQPRVSRSTTAGSASVRPRSRRPRRSDGRSESACASASRQGHRASASRTGCPWARSTSAASRKRGLPGLVPEAGSGDYVSSTSASPSRAIDEAEAARGSSQFLERAGRAATELEEPRRMKYLDEYRDPRRSRRSWPRAIAGAVDPALDASWRSAAGRPTPSSSYGIDELLPPRRRAGPRPGLPGLRHPARDDRPGARAIAARPDVIFCSFGDMLRVPGLARRPARSSRRRGARRAGRLLAARRGARSRAANPDRAGRVLRHRLRDHRAGQRHGRLAGARDGG